MCAAAAGGKSFESAEEFAQWLGAQSHLSMPVQASSTPTELNQSQVAGNKGKSSAKSAISPKPLHGIATQGNAT